MNLCYPFVVLRRWTGRCGGLVHFLLDWCRFRRLSATRTQRFSLRWRDRAPQLDDHTTNTTFDRHYVYHTAWAARILATERPTVHFDIGSSLYFVTSVSAFMPVRFYDYRPAQLELSSLTCHRADLGSLPFADGSVESISCMHVVEHVGLGRYGDPLDPDGDLKAMAELQRVVAPRGSLLIVVPVGKPRVCFNAHRIYSFQQVVRGFPRLTLEQAALIPDRTEEGGLILGADPHAFDRQTYGCGCFWFKGPA